MAASADTRGRRELRKILEGSEWSQSSLARELRISQPSVASWIAGHTRPSETLRVALERLLGIKSNSWMTDAEYRLAATHVFDGRFGISLFVRRDLEPSRTWQPLGWPCYGPGSRQHTPPTSAASGLRPAAVVNAENTGIAK